ncbi:hypothetical protein BC829DRAFT_397113 [Chytridium lagenaria]|nr:hypothetical protein BC829DRAFT_397113 [Chytridium lagenaria]
MAGGDAEWCAILVAVNALLQLLFSAQPRGSYQIDLWLITRSVLIFLGIPLVGGVITRFSLRFALGLKWKGAYKWYDETLMKYLGPTSLLGPTHCQRYHGVLRVSVPSLLYFTIVFSGTFLICLYFTRTPFAIAVTQSFTAAGNNFELAIAVAVASYGIDSKEALATVIGPLIEVPVLLGLVHLALAFKTRYDAHMIRKYGSANPDGVNEDTVAGCGKLQQDCGDVGGKEELARDEDDFLKATKTDMESTRKAEHQGSIATLNA